VATHMISRTLVMVLSGLTMGLTFAHKRPSGRLAFAAAVSHIAALAAWAAIVAPANAAIGEWGRSGIPPDWEKTQIRWESGHTAGFALLTMGFCLLVLTLLREQSD
jgi:hypothetical protein